MQVIMLAGMLTERASNPPCNPSVGGRPTLVSLLLIDVAAVGTPEVGLTGLDILLLCG